MLSKISSQMLSIFLLMILILESINSLKTVQNKLKVNRVFYLNTFSIQKPSSTRSIIEDANLNLKNIIEGTSQSSISLENHDISQVNNEEKDQIDLLYDSDCPICAMEVEFLRKRDIFHKIRFTDLSSPDYNPADHGNVQFSEGMRKIRAVLPDKSVITGVEVFRQTYRAIGLGWIFDLTNVPLIGRAADYIYDLWAENRLRITGRGDLADVLKERSENLRKAEPIECEDGCAIDFDDLPVD
eukprot:gene7658-10421_t